MMIMQAHGFVSIKFLVGVFASTGSVLYGYDLGVIAEVVGSSSYISLFNPTSSET